MSGTVFHPLVSRALVAVRGPDWRPFLQNLLSNDVESLAAGQARAALLLTPQGKLLFDLIVAADPDGEGALIDVLAERRAALVQRLRLYRLRAKVEIEPAPGAVWAARGAAPGPGWLADPRLEALGWRGYGVEPPAEAALEDEAAYRAHALALGVPDPALDCIADKTFPLEADFDLLNAIDFHKGCYVGQETTSRVKRRSGVKTRMVPIAFDGPAPAYGTQVSVGDLRAGEVLSGVEGRAMALLRLERALSGDLTVDGRKVALDIPAWWPEGTLPSPTEPGSD
ncbi:MAG TPA: folate-binding protein [Caulobacteraceae bacterium]|nr:folate-binding protein [Caulobacteraceae bacterium]